LIGPADELCWPVASDEKQHEFANPTNSQKAIKRELQLTIFLAIE
jgi:hypothetical protein